MKRFEDRISIHAPAGRVFAYVADFTRHGEWAGHGLEVTKSGDGAVAVGTTFSTTAKQFGTQREQSTITELTPDKAFAWDSTGALGRALHWFSLSDEGDSTTLSKARRWSTRRSLRRSRAGSCRRTSRRASTATSRTSRRGSKRRQPDKVNRCRPSRSTRPRRPRRRRPGRSAR